MTKKDLKTSEEADKKLQIVYMNIDDLIDAEYNPREMSEEEARQLTNSIKRFGIVDPAIVNKHVERENIIIGGHQRIRIARQMGYKKFPCVLEELTPDKERELNLRLNKNTGHWDWDKLANYFDEEELKDVGFTDVELFGDTDFSDDTSDDFNDASADDADHVNIQIKIIKEHYAEYEASIEKLIQKIGEKGKCKIQG